MTKRELTHAQQAKKVLKQHFPNCIFSAVTGHYNRFTICYSFGPKDSEIEEVLNAFNSEFYFLVSRDFSTSFRVEISKAWAKKQHIKFTNLSRFDDNMQRSFNEIAYSFLNETSFSTNYPTFKGLQDSGITCGSIGELYFIDYEETIKGEVVRPDLKAMRDTNIEKEKESKRLYDLRRAKEKEEHAAYQERERKAKEVEKSYKYEVLNIDKKEWFINIQRATIAKMNTVQEYIDLIRLEGDCENENYKIVEVIKCDSKTFRALANRLMYDHEVFNGKGGTNSHYEVPKEFEGKELFQLPEEIQQNWIRESHSLGLFIYCTEFNQCFVSDPQGYNYSRYTHLLRFDDEGNAIKKADSFFNLAE